MKLKRSVVPRFHLVIAAGLTLLAVTFAGVQANAGSQPFTHMYITGDSLSDTGNYYRLSGGLPASPYASGRFCDGPVWVEYLATKLGMDYQPDDNFAVGGATTGRLNTNDGVAGKEYPGLLDQIDAMEAQGNQAEPERALYIVGAGANDFFLALATGQSPQSVIANGVNNTVTAVQRLGTSGARFIVVMNVPDLGVTPMALSKGLGAPLAQLVTAYNQILNQALDQLALAGIRTIRLDAFKVLDEMAYFPNDYGFSNVTIPCLYAPAGSNPEDFLFWDGVHPTTGAHEVLAEEAMEQIMAAVSPSNGAGAPDSKAHSLNGLVNATLHHQ